MNYIFISQDPYPKEKAVDDLKAKLLGKKFSQLNLGIYYADGDNIKDILLSAKTVPFGARHRMVIVRKVDKFAQNDLDILIKYLKNPAHHTTLILDIDKEIKNKSWRELASCTKTVNFEKSKYKGFKKCIESTMLSVNKTISNDAVALLRELVGGGDLNTLKNELEKLALYVGDKGVISKEDVETIVGKRADEDIFRLIDAISQQDVQESLDIIEGLLYRKVRPHEIIGLLAWHFRRTYLKNRRAPIKQLHSKIDLLLSTDFAIKRSRIDPTIGLEVAIVKLCMKDEPAAVSRSGTR